MPSRVHPRSSRRSRSDRPQRRSPNPSGVHLLSSRSVVEQLIRSSGVGDGDLVIDFGAGPGAVTGPLARTGATVLAVERDDDFVGRLRRRFADLPQVRVVHADLRSVPLPRRAFAVVASIPYSVTSPLLARLLDSPRTPLGGADLVVEWGLAKRLTEACPRSLGTAWWAARIDLTLRRRIPASSFSPAPSVDSAHLVIRRPAGLRAPVQRVLWAVLSSAYGARGEPAGTAFDRLLPRRRAQRLLTANGVDPARPAGTVPVRRWRDIAVALAADHSASWPALPHRLDRR